MKTCLKGKTAAGGSSEAGLVVKDPVRTNGECSSNRKNMESQKNVTQLRRLSFSVS